MKLNTRDMILCSFFAAIIAVLAQISIPIQPVPFTFQVIGVALAGSILGPKKGFISVVLYILLGAIGAPVFAGMKGGIQMLVGPTGGFLMAFPFMALIIGYFTEKNNKATYIFLGGLLGLILSYLLGSIQLSFVAKISYTNALTLGVLPFIVFDLIKLSMVAMVSVKIKKTLNLRQGFYSQ